LSIGELQGSAERAILAGVEWKRRRPGRNSPSSSTNLHDEAEESLEELGELAASAGAVVVDRAFQTRDGPEAATLIGAGKVRELAALAASTRADVVLFDHDLTPTQQRNL
jgi:GTPase